MQAVQQLNQIQNFKSTARIFVDAKENYKFVRVLNGVANVTNGLVLIRRQVGIPDGTYHIGMQGELVPVIHEYGLSYPDVELVKPPLDKLKPMCEIPKDVVTALVAFANEVIRLKGTIVLDKGGVFMLQNPAFNVAFPFNYPRQEEVDSKHFLVAFMEMMQYSSVYLLQEIRHQNEVPNTPLIIGRDWGHCALIFTKRS